MARCLEWKETMKVGAKEGKPTTLSYRNPITDLPTGPEPSPASRGIQGRQRK